MAVTGRRRSGERKGSGGWPWTGPGASGEPKERRVTVTGRRRRAGMGRVTAVLVSFAITSFVLGAARMSGQWLAPDRAAPLFWD